MSCDHSERCAKSALHTAALRGYTQIVGLFLEASADTWSLFARTRASSALRQPTCGRSQPPLVHRPSVQQKSDHFEPGRPWGQYCCSVPQYQPLQMVASAGYLAGAIDSASAQTSAMSSEPSGTWIWYSTRTSSAPWFWYWSRRRDDGSLRMTVMSSKAGTP